MPPGSSPGVAKNALNFLNRLLQIVQPWWKWFSRIFGRPCFGRLRLRGRGESIRILGKLGKAPTAASLQDLLKLLIGKATGSEFFDLLHAFSCAYAPCNRANRAIPPALYAATPGITLTGSKRSAPPMWGNAFAP